MKGHERTHESGADKVVSDLKQIVEDSQTLLADSAEATGDRMRHARNRLADALESAKEAYGKLQTKAIGGAKATDRVIRDNPYQSIGIAFGVGLLIGVLVTRR